MKTYTVTSRKINLAFIIMLMLLLLALSCTGQTWQRATHFGLETSLDINGFSSESNKIRAMARGVSAGLVVGNNLLKGRLRAELYGPTSYSKCAGKLIGSEALVNFYPLEFFRTRKNVLDIYFTTGFRFTNIATTDENCNSGEQSKGKVMSQVSGMGMEVLLPYSNKFIHVFGETLFSNPFHNSSKVSASSTSWSSKTVSLNIGIRFGIHKTNSN